MKNICWQAIVLSTCLQLCANEVMRAAQEDLLLQPNFAKEETIRRFFNAGKVTWLGRNPGLTAQSMQFFAVEIQLPLIEGVRAHLQAGCTRTATKIGTGHTKNSVVVGASLRIYGKPIPQLTLERVREVFGMETENEVDNGASPDSQDRTPANKGWVVYEDRRKSSREGQKLGTTFYFALTPENQSIFLPIAATDVVEAITVATQRSRKWED
jgi:hypothetical protein